MQQNDSLADGYLQAPVCGRPYKCKDGAKVSHPYGQSLRQL